MKRYKTTQAAWIREALERFEQPLLRYAAAITGDADLARDVVQETFLKLCNAERKKVESHLAPWLYTVARNHALNVRKKEGRMIPLREGQAEAQPDRNPGPGAQAVKNETNRLVSEALSTLPEQEQEVCRLKFQDELTYREIAQIMDISLGTVSNLITHALDHIRQQLRTRNALVREV